MRQFPAAAAIAALAIALAGCSGKESVKIRVNEATLQDDVAVSELYTKIETAAAHLCAKGEDAELSNAQEVLACQRATVRAAVGRAGIASLSAYYEAMGRRADADSAPITVASR